MDSVPVKVTGLTVMPGMVKLLEESWIDQLFRSLRVPTKPMVDVTPDRVMLTLPRSRMPHVPISADRALTVRLSSTGSPAEISSPVTAATLAVSFGACFSRTSSPSAKVAPSRATLALGAVQSVPVTVVSVAIATTSSLTRTASSWVGGASCTLSHMVQNCSWGVGPPGEVGGAHATTEVSIARAMAAGASRRAITFTMSSSRVVSSLRSCRGRGQLVVVPLFQMRNS